MPEPDPEEPTMDEHAASLIMAVVPKELVSGAMRAAMEAGATGATHWKGHGTGVDVVTLFDALFRLEPEREVVGVVAPEGIADQVFDAIRDRVPFGSPGSGFVISLPLSRVAGIANVAVA